MRNGSARGIPMSIAYNRNVRSADILSQGKDMLDFGFTLKPDITPNRIISLTQQAEHNGFAYGWLFDSHMIWMEPYPLLALMAAHSTNMHLGTCVTNPIARDATVTASLLATLSRISSGRM